MSRLVVFQSNRSDSRRRIQWSPWVFLSPRMAYTPEEIFLEDVSDDARIYEHAYKSDIYNVVGVSLGSFYSVNNGWLKDVVFAANDLPKY